MPGGIRINRYLAMCGFGSRRSCEELVRSGFVEINGNTVDSLSLRVNDSDIVKVKGKEVRPRSSYRYFAYYKPIGVLTTMHDPKGRRTVRDKLPPWMKDLKPVGRLDRDTEGLLILTDDGSFAHKIAHPGGGINKRYYVLVEGEISKAGLRKLEDGVKLKDGHTGRCKLIEVRTVGDNTGVTLDVGYGRKRMIRQMLAAIKHKIIVLKRIAVGSVKLGDLAPGEYRELEGSEIEAIWADNDG